MSVSFGSLLIVSFWSFACKQGVRGPQRSEQTIYLDAKSDWQGTALWVKKGQKVRLECHGTWAVAPSNESRRWPDTGPEGHGRHPGEKVHRSGDLKKELPGTPFGTLLGKVSNVVFPIGDRKEIVAPSEGELFLVINDYPFYRHDNRGGLTVTIVPQ
ncbi:MAG: hypothetical protein ISS61_14345 [Desulfobacteraceae bacterium]|nr:hypothetical protein [Desulfobacteraceae bacterium]